MMMTNAAISAISVSPEITYPLRRQVLGRPPTPAEIDGDLNGWGHYAVISIGSVIATGIIHPQPPPPPFDQRMPDSWRIIGVAVDPQFRRRGIGTLVLTALLAHAHNHEAVNVWCNARTDAAELYRQHGFDEVSARCDDPVGGRQLLMSRRL